MSQFTNENVVSGTVTANAGTGPFPVSDNGGSLTIDGTVTANAGTGPFPVSDNGGTLTVDGTVSVDNLPGASTATATVTSVAVGVTSTTLSVSNANKTKVIIFNESGTLFVKYGATASSTSYTTRLTANTYHEVIGYHGVIDAIKASGTTNVLVTELGI